MKYFLTVHKDGNYVSLIEILDFNHITQTNRSTRLSESQLKTLSELEFGDRVTFKNTEYIALDTEIIGIAYDRNVYIFFVDGEPTISMSDFASYVSEVFALKYEVDTEDFVDFFNRVDDNNFDVANFNDYEFTGYRITTRNVHLSYS